MGALPTVAVVGPAGRMIVNATDLEMYRARGYRLEGEAPVREPAHGPGNDEADASGQSDGAQEVTPITRRGELDRLTVAELRQRADALGIEGYASLKKADLIEAMMAAEQE